MLPNTLIVLILSKAALRHDSGMASIAMVILAINVARMYVFLYYFRL